MTFYVKYSIIKNEIKVESSFLQDDVKTIYKINILGGITMAMVKTSDLPSNIALKLFVELNKNNVKVSNFYKVFPGSCLADPVIITDREPRDLIYPEGWYYAKGSFRNKHTSSTGIYEEISMIKPNGDFWQDSAKYCTLDLEEDDDY